MTDEQHIHPAATLEQWRMSARSWMAAGIVAAVLVAVTLFPSLDLKISAAFYVPGRGFPWRNSAMGEFVRHDVPSLVLATLLACVIAWVAGMWRQRTTLRFSTREIAYLLATLIVGPGLMVESVLKPHSGRARPQDLTIFGGNADYTSPLWPAHACASNCSFVSGHAAIAFWLTAYAFVVPSSWRGIWLVGGVVAGVAVGTMRVMQGAHFPSDVVYAGVIVIAVNVILARLILAPDAGGERHGPSAAP